jgi:hypothetical protein
MGPVLVRPALFIVFSPSLAITFLQHGNAKFFLNFKHISMHNHYLGDAAKGGNIMNEESKGPVTGGANKQPTGRGTSNRDWWPNQLKLEILHQHSCGFVGFGFVASS